MRCRDENAGGEEQDSEGTFEWWYCSKTNLNLNKLSRKIKSAATHIPVVCYTSKCQSVSHSVAGAPGLLFGLQINNNISSEYAFALRIKFCAHLLPAWARLLSSRRNRSICWLVCHTRPRPGDVLTPEFLQEENEWRRECLGVQGDFSNKPSLHSCLHWEFLISIIDVIFGRIILWREGSLGYVICSLYFTIPLPFYTSFKSKRRWGYDNIKSINIILKILWCKRFHSDDI